MSLAPCFVGVWEETDRWTDIKSNSTEAEIQEGTSGGNVLDHL